ncbi:MAG: tetratricopeptide repeat protein, partial [Methylococcales bacterium]|nr:tetratricopeptide repeat protein [Methylococcales bacterium]
MIVLFNPSVASETNTLIKQATILITAKKIEKAYQLLSPFADDKAGNPEFDYLYGLLLQKKHHYTQAVLVLERALLMRPEHVATQSALAKSYIALKEFKKAEQLQQKLQQEHETSASNEIKTLEEQKKKDEKIRYTVNGFIRSTGGYDDNLTNGPDENFITILSAKQLGTIYVGKGLEKDQDFFVGVSGSLGLKTQFSNNFGINVGIWGSKRFNRKRPDEEIAAMSSSLGGHYQYGHNSISIDLKYQSIWINTLHYQEQYALLGQWYRPLWKNNALALHFNINTTRHPHSKT